MYSHSLIESIDRVFTGQKSTGSALCHTVPHFDLISDFHKTVDACPQIKDYMKDTVSRRLKMKQNH